MKFSAVPVVGDLPCAAFHYEILDSTNLELKRQMPAEDTAIYADFQTDGRGQGDHIWHCRQKQGLLMSLLFHPPKAMTADYLLRLSAVAVLHSVQRHILDCPYQAQIKAPNDILIEGRKLGGILLENHFLGSHLAASIIGIGLNLYQDDFSGDYARPPVSFRQLGIAVETDLLFTEILKEFYQLAKHNKQKINHDYHANLLSHIML